MQTDRILRINQDCSAIHHTATWWPSNVMDGIHGSTSIEGSETECSIKRDVITVSTFILSQNKIQR